MTRTAPKPEILLVGAYERDNFGDLLFLLVTERYLSRASVFPSSLSQSDMSPLLGRFVFPYSMALEETKFDAVWVVGGEIGTPTPRDALRFSLTPENFETLAQAAPRDAARLERVLMGSVPPTSAYVPDLRRFVLNETTPLVINSVGVSRIKSHPDHRYDELVAGLRRATDISVRDNPSSSLLTSCGVQHELNPDLIHTVALNTDLPPFPSVNGRLVAQASTSFLNSVGYDAFAAEIASLAKKSGLPLTLFAAGTAHLHDSFEDYERLRALIGNFEPSVEVSVLTERNPWKLASAIKSCAVWVGTSLHGRIVAAAFDRPRVSLTNPKVSHYAETWDDGMPYSVGLGDMRAAVESARSPALAAKTAVGDDRARQAHEAMRSLVAKYVEE